MIEQITKQADEDMTTIKLLPSTRDELTRFKRRRKAGNQWGLQTYDEAICDLMKFAESKGYLREK